MIKQIGIDKIHQLDFEILKEIKRICQKGDIPFYLAFGTALGSVRHNGFIPWDVDADTIMPVCDMLRFEELCKKELDPRFELQTAADPKHPEYFMRMRLKNQPDAEVYVDIFLLIGAPEQEAEQKKLYKGIMRLRKLRNYRCMNVRDGKTVGKKIKRFLARTVTHLLPIGFYNHRFFQLCNRVDYHTATRLYCPCGAYDARKPRWFSRDIYEPVRIGKFESADFYLPNRVEDYLSEYYGDYKKFPSKEAQNFGLQFKTTINEPDL